MANPDPAFLFRQVYNAPEQLAQLRASNRQFRDWIDGEHVFYRLPLEEQRMLAAYALLNEKIDLIHEWVGFGELSQGMVWFADHGPVNWDGALASVVPLLTIIEPTRNAVLVLSEFPRFWPLLLPIICEHVLSQVTGSDTSIEFWRFLHAHFDLSSDPGVLLREIMTPRPMDLDKLALMRPDEALLATRTWRGHTLAALLDAKLTDPELVWHGQTTNELEEDMRANPAPSGRTDLLFRFIHTASPLRFSFLRA